MLDIACPHLDDLGSSSFRTARFRDLTTTGGVIPLKAPDPAQTLTPPEETSSFVWRGGLGAATGAAESTQDLAEVGGPTRRVGSIASHASIPTSTTASIQPIAVDSNVTGTNTAEMGMSLTGDISIAALDVGLHWLSPAVMAIATCIGASGGSGGSLKVLSHALPMPAVPGHVYANIIDAIRAQCEPGQLSWINLMHAVPGRLNFSDLPSSPPSTPAPPLDGEDYFTTKIFSSAVPTASDDHTMESQRRTERLLSPPGTLDLSIIERYIPPVSKRELQNMFSIEPTSMLVDRLIELSPDGGCLTFIYPTKVGGRTFVHEYLDPILDPLLRTMMSLYSLSADFGNFINASDSGMANSLFEFPVAEAELRDLCDRLNRLGRSDRSRSNRLHGMEGNFEVVYAAQRMVVLDSSVWANWWKGQEKPRLSAAIARYFQRGNRLPRDGKAQQGVLVQELVDGVVRGASKVDAPGPGVEVGVFVIKRSQSA